MRHRILITGANGVIGRLLLSELKTLGYEADAAVRNIESGVDQFAVNLESLEEISELFEQRRYDVVIHCAAQTNHSKLSRSEYQKQNSLLTRNISTVCEKYRAHLIFMSSKDVYGMGEEVLRLPNDIDEKFLTPYATSKLEDEKFILKTSSYFDILRLCPVYSVDIYKDLKKRVLIPGTSLTFELSPSPKYSLCHSQVLVETILNILRCEPGRRIHHVCDAVQIPQNKILSFLKLKSRITIKRNLLRTIDRVIPQTRATYAIKYNLQKLYRTSKFELGCLEIKISDLQLGVNDG